MYKLVYEKKYGSAVRNPWSEEELAKNGIITLHKDEDLHCLWIKAGPHAYCFINNFDEVEHYLNESSATNAVNYLNTHYDRKEDINEIINKFV